MTKRALFIATLISAALQFCFSIADESSFDSAASTPSVCSDLIEDENGQSHLVNRLD